jgi:hypothetical protein
VRAGRSDALLLKRLVTGADGLWVITDFPHNTRPTWRPTPLRRAVIALGWIVLVASIAGVVTGALRGGLVTWVVAAASSTLAFLVAAAVPSPSPVKRRSLTLGGDWQDVGSPLDAYRSHEVRRAQKPPRSVVRQLLRYPPD